jgi:hypothetical protein
MKNRKTIETPESDSKNKDLKIRPKSRHESSLLHVLPIIEDNHQGAFTPSKHTKYNDKKTLKHFHQ